jgi:hypothetical protein
MTNDRKMIIPAIVLILVLLACNAQAQVTPASDPGLVGTSVASTMTALVGLLPSPSETNPPPTSVPVTTETASPPATSPCDNASFVSETIPDGTVESPGALFTKTWRLKNVGTCTWNDSYALVFDSGSILGAPAWNPLMATVAPGQEIDLSVPLQAPSTPGTYTGVWRLRNASSVLFGVGPGNDTFWVKITVPAFTPTPTSAPGLVIPFPLIPLLIIDSQQVLAQVSVPASGMGHAVANCPSGSVVTGGGFAANPELFVYNSSGTGNGWEVYAQNLTGAGQTLNSYALCLSGTSGTTQQVYGQVTASGGGTGHAMVYCPSGSVVTGGGFAGSTNLLVYNSSGTGNGWEVYAKNLSGSDLGLNSYAICLSGVSGTTQQVYTQVTTSASSIGNALAACPSGTYLTGGGYAGNKNLVVYSESATGTGWDVYAQNTSGSSQLLNSYAICLTLP